MIKNQRIKALNNKIIEQSKNQRIKESKKQRSIKEAVYVTGFSIRAL